MKNNEEFESNGLQKDGKCCYNAIPTRFVFLFLGFIGFNLIYAYKVVLSVTIVAMVGHQSNNSDYSDDCKDPWTNTTTANHGNNTEQSQKIGDFDWTEQQSTAVLGAFFYGYVLTQVPGGLLAERFGAKWIFGSSILITALLSLVSPWAASISYSAFFAVRVLQGLAEGVVFPVMNSMLAKWLPKMERSLGGTIVFTGAQIGTVVTMPLAGVLSDGTFWGGWRAIFYLLGIAGCVWFALWAVFVFESPERHPFISSKELNFIKKSQGIEAVKEVGLKLQISLNDYTFENREQRPPGKRFGRQCPCGRSLSLISAKIGDSSLF